MSANGTTRLVLPVLITAICALGFAQPMPLTFSAELTGVALAAPVETGATGEVTAILVGSELTVVGSFDGLSGPMPARFGIATGASLRSGRPFEAGESIRLEAPQAVLGNGPFARLMATNDVEGRLTGVFSLTPAQVDALKQGAFYVHVATSTHPDGELRGQLTTDVVLDLEPADLVGIWQVDGVLDAMQLYADGTWTTIDTLADAGADADTRTWSLDGNVLTLVLRNGKKLVRYQVLHQNGRRLGYVMDGSEELTGRWEEHWKVDEQGNRLSAR